MVSFYALPSYAFTCTSSQARSFGVCHRGPFIPLSYPRPIAFSSGSLSGAPFDASLCELLLLKKLIMPARLPSGLVEKTLDRRLVPSAFNLTGYITSDGLPARRKSCTSASRSPDCQIPLRKQTYECFPHHQSHSSFSAQWSSLRPQMQTSLLSACVFGRLVELSRQSALSSLGPIAQDWYSDSIYIRVDMDGRGNGCYRCSLGISGWEGQTCGQDATRRRI